MALRALAIVDRKMPSYTGKLSLTACCADFSPR